MTSTIKTPEGWIETKLGNNVVIRGGKRLPKGETIISKKTDHPYIRITDMENNQIKNGVQFISDDVFSSISRYIVNTGDVILSIVGTIGLVAMIDEKLNNANLTENCVKFVNLKNIDNKFLYYFLISKLGQDEIIKNTVGAVQKKLPIYGIENINIILPPLPEQKAIAGVLSSFDDKIELLRAENQTLEEMGQTLFKEWFGKYKVGDELPDGWKVGKLTDIATFLNGIALQKFPPKENEIGLPIIKIREMKAGITNETDRATKDIDEKYIIKNEDILFSWSGSLELVFWEYGPGALNQHLFKVTSDRYPKWFYYYWISHHLNEFRSIASNKATTMGHIQRCHLERAEVIIPNDNDLYKFNEVMDKLLKKIFNNKNKIHSLAETRDQLLPKLMSGEVRIEF